MNRPPEQPSVADALIAAEVEGIQRRDTAQRRANAEPLPGPLAGAFTLDELKVFGITIRPVVASDFIFLKKLNSPLYRRTFELAEHQRKIAAGEADKDSPLPGATDFDEEECVEMVYQFTIPLAQARKEVSQGRAFFRERALQSLTDRLPVDSIPRLVGAVVENFTRAFSTAVQYQGDQKDGVETTVFTTPGQAGATASGWWFDYIARLAGGDPTKEQFVTDELPMIKGFAYIAWKIENNEFVAAHATTPRYIAQETDCILRLARGEGGHRPDEVLK